MFWFLCISAALCVGLSKSGFPGVSLLTVALMAQAFPPKESTGVLLPLLIFGDLCAVKAFRKDALWNQILRMLPPTMVGIFIGFWLMKNMPDNQFRPVLGWLLLLTVVLQSIRSAFPQLGAAVPHTRAFAWTMGIWAGCVTMLANAAGPVMAIYLLSLSLPKQNLVGTSAWFFLIVNVFKLPFSWQLGLIQTPALLLDLSLCPLVIIGTFIGRSILHRIPQRLFEAILLVSAAAAALKMAL
ncbi:MAG: sulfite exporter TauE/SafE family protein [Verrucomicrobiota bacterium]